MQPPIFQRFTQSFSVSSARFSPPSNPPSGPLRPHSVPFLPLRSRPGSPQNSHIKLFHNALHPPYSMHPIRLHADMMQRGCLVDACRMPAGCLPGRRRPRRRQRGKQPPTGGTEAKNKGERPPEGTPQKADTQPYVTFFINKMGIYRKIIVYLHFHKLI